MAEQVQQPKPDPKALAAALRAINGSIVPNPNPGQFPPQQNGIMSILLGHRG